MEIDITAETEKMRSQIRKAKDKTGVGFDTNEEQIKSTGMFVSAGALSSNTSQPTIKFAETEK